MFVVFLEKDDLEIGQERETIGFNDDVKITPFNIDEEMKEGHYHEKDFEQLQPGKQIILLIIRFLFYSLLLVINLTNENPFPVKFQRHYRLN